MKHTHPFQIVGAAVRILRQRRGLTLDRLADDAGLDADLLWKIEAGRGEISMPVLESISAALGLTPEGVITAAYSLPPGRRAA